MNAPTDKDKALLRQALGHLAAETMPAPGWEQRAIPRRLRRLLWLIPAAAAIAAIVVVTAVGTRHGASSEPKVEQAFLPATTEPKVEQAIQPAPPSPKPDAKVAGKIACSTQPEITVLLPEPEPTEIADYPDMPIGDYIDMMIEEQLLANAEIISTII